MQKRRRKSFDLGFYVLVILALVLSYYALYGVNRGQEVSYAQARQLFVQERVESFQVSDHTLTMVVRDGRVESIGSRDEILPRLFLEETGCTCMDEGAC